jgi:predicted RNase H-like HicB family nuclease
MQSLKGNDMAKTTGATEKDALASADEATQAGLDGAVQANEARALGAKLSAAKTEATESAKGI